MGKGLVVGIIIAALLSSAFWIFVLYSKDQSVTGSFVANVQDYPTVNQINFDDELSPFGTTVQFVDSNSSPIVQISWDFEYMSISNDVSPFQVLVSNNTQGDILNIAVSLSNLNFSIPSEFGNVLVNSQFTVTFNNQYLINYTADKSAGDVDINGDGVNFTQLTASLTTGSLNVNLSNSEIQSSLIATGTTGSINLNLNNVSVAGDISAQLTTGDNNVTIANSIVQSAIDMGTTTGDNQLTLNNIVLTQNLTLNQITTTGDNAITWNADQALGYGVNISTTATTGDNSINLQLPFTTTRYNFDAGVSTGTVSINAQSYGKSIASQIGNPNNSALDLVSVYSRSTTGDITIQYADN